MDTLLARLDFPRESEAAVARARSILVESLRDAGLEPTLQDFTSVAGRAEAAGFLCLAAGLALALALAVAARQRAWAVVAAIVAALALASLAGLADPLLAVRPEANVAVTIAPRDEAMTHVVLTAHYDSKTEWLDHVERGILFTIVSVLALATVVAVVARRRRAARFLLGGVAVGAGLCGAQLASSVWVGERSPGAADDAAACALLADLAAAVESWPLERTRLTVLWLAAEERAAQGSRAWVASDAARALGAPDAVLNLECLGVGPKLGFLAREWTELGWATAPPALLRSIESAFEAPLARLEMPAVTDAGSWRRAGIPALTLVGLPRSGLGPRGLHSAADARASLDLQALATTRQSIEHWLAAWDAASGRPSALAR